MDWDALPHSPADCRAAIDAARAGGPPALDRLAALCLWFAGGQSDPHQSYEGPGGGKPLPYLAAVLEYGVLGVLDEVRPLPGHADFITYGRSVAREFPPPRDPRERTQTLDGGEARRLVRQAVAQSERKPSLSTRHERYLEALFHLWERGASRADLEPLFDALKPVTEAYLALGDDGGYKRAHLAGALARLGEWDQAMQYIEATALPDEAALRLRSAGAQWFIATARPDLARPLLDALLARRDELPAQRRGYWLRALAEVLLYAGEEALAFEVCPQAERLLTGWEGIVALGRYYHRGVADPAGLRARLKASHRIEPPKARAAEQYDILEPLLAIGAEEAAQETLNALQGTLLATPLWSKREHRTDGAVQAMLPYLDRYPAMIHTFAAGLLAGTAADVGDFWNIVFVVSGLRWLIWKWAGTEGIRRIVEFLRAWDARPNWKEVV